MAQLFPKIIPVSALGRGVYCRDACEEGLLCDQHNAPSRQDELGTFDVVVERSDNGIKSHAITTAFIVRVGSEATIMLDAQNSEVEWRLPGEWSKYQLAPFVKQVLEIFTGYKE